MNHQKLTQRETKTRRATLQLLLLLCITAFLAVPGIAQDQMSDSSQTQVQRKTMPVIDFDRHKRFAFAADTNSTLDNSATEPEAKEEVQVFIPAHAPNSLFKRAPETTGDSSGSSTSQPASSLSRFAIFGDAGVAIPHGDFNIFFDPGFTVDVGLEYIITSQFSAEGILGYNRFSLFFGGHTSLYQVSANGKFYFVDESSNVRPFVNGGLGVYVTDSGTAHFGGNVGVGVLFVVTPRFGFQASYNFHAFSAGSNVRYSTVQGGVRFRF